MCIFSQPVPHVGSTQIYASRLDEREHATVYRMDYRAGEPVAMVLPVPVRAGSGDDAVTFVDLGAYRDFFDDLTKCCPIRVAGGPRSRPGAYGVGPPRPTLKTHEVGDYVASFVPTLGDFDRLDPRFRVPDAAWDELPDYTGFGFAVVQLQPGKATKTVQPIAYRYPAERPDEVYFPTVHLHDGRLVPAVADYQHDLFTQPEEFCGWDWNHNDRWPRDVVDFDRARGLVDPARPLAGLMIRGDRLNADLVVRNATPRPQTIPRFARATRAIFDQDPRDVRPTIRWWSFERFVPDSERPWWFFGASKTRDETR